MKRERLNTAEVEMNNGALDVNIWNMLKNRQEAVELINQKFGTDISVELNFAVFSEDSGNATGEQEEVVEEVDEVPMEVDQADEELQVDGVSEDEDSNESNEESAEENSDTDADDDEQERDE